MPGCTINTSPCSVSNCSSRSRVRWIAACLRRPTGEESKAVSLTDPEVTMGPAIIAAAASMNPREMPPSWRWERF